MRCFLRRLVFVLLSTAVVVFFSEKAYWYVQGYAIGELILFYAVPVYACMWALDHFRVRRPAALVLIAALYAFLIEGVLTPVIYEAGLLDPVMPAYFIGWHGLLSIFFGWYLLRKWLVGGQWLRILGASTLFGLFWGLWSLTYWLPESVAEFEALAAQGEPTLPGAWPITDFATYVLAFSLLLMIAHGLLGRGFWLRSFRPTRIEKGAVILLLSALFGLMVLPVLPQAILKLAAMLLVLWGALEINRRREHQACLLSAWAGPVRAPHLLALLAMPAAAVLIYAWGNFFQPGEDFLRAIFEGLPILQGILGAAVFLWALATTLWPRLQASARESVESVQS